MTVQERGVQLTAAALPALLIAMFVVAISGSLRLNLGDVSSRILPIAILAAPCALAWMLHGSWGVLTGAALAVVTTMALIPPYAANHWSLAQGIAAGLGLAVYGYAMLHWAKSESTARSSSVTLCVASIGAAAIVLDQGSFVFAGELAAVGMAQVVGMVSRTARPQLLVSGGALFAALIAAACLYGGLSPLGFAALAVLPWLATLTRRLSTCVL